jgi:hypothetical protein
LYTLITAATTAPAQKLKNSMAGANVILGDYLELPAFMLKNLTLIKLPNPSAPAYAHQILTLCLDKEIDKIYPLRNSEKELLNEASQLFTEYGITVICDNPNDLMTH